MVQVAHFKLYLRGFRPAPVTPPGYEDFNGQVIYLRKAQVPTRRSGSAPPIRRLPIVFVHGIGIGLSQYLQIIDMLPKDTDVFLVEWPHVAMQMSHDVPSADMCVGKSTNFYCWIHYRVEFS